MPAEIPSIKSVNKMTLDQLNQQIDLLGKRINQRMSKLSEMKYDEASFTLFRLQKLAAEWTSSGPEQMRHNFFRGKAKTIESGRARLKNIIKGLNFTTSTKTGIKKTRKQKKETFAQNYIKDGDLDDEQWEKLTDLFNKFRSSDIDSGTIIDVFFSDESYHIFDTADDLLAFIEEKGEGVYRRQLGPMKRSKYTYKYDPLTGEFVKYERKTGNEPPKYEQLKFSL